jgi:DNA (cytosine-5)-methyltransferase 1
MRMVDLFSGIGGFSLAASWVWPDIEIECFVEIDPFCQKVLRKNFPGVPICDDIKKIQWVVADAEILGRGNGASANKRTSTGEINTPCNRINISPVDLLTGGFPCQPFSCAGKRAGTEDDRHLWPEMLRAIHEIKPRWVIAENVPGIFTIENGLVFEGVCTDLEAEGYEVQPVVVPACAKGAPHRRDRVWIVANSKHCRFNGSGISVCRQGEEEVSLSSGADCHAENAQGKRLEGGRDGAGRKSAEGMRLFSAGSDCHAADTERGKALSPKQGRFYSEPCGENRGKWEEHWYTVATRTCVRGMDARVPNRVDRLKSLGNSIVPQVAYEIMLAIKGKI